MYHAPGAVSRCTIHFKGRYVYARLATWRPYGQRIRKIEHASFTPVVMSATGGLAHEATYFYKRLASLLSRKWGDKYSVVMGWLRCSLSFSLLRSAIQCVHGARSSIQHYVVAPPPMDLVRVESNLSLEDDHGR